jgi:DNA-binding GntR family transcriptional regulator
LIYHLIQEYLARDSLYKLLAEKYQLLPAWAAAEIEALLPKKQQARLLDLKAGRPVLVAHRVTYSA